MNRIAFTLLFFIGFLSLSAQTGSIRGNVYDKDTGEPVPFCNLQLSGTTLGANTDLEGFFTITNVPVGDYQLVSTYIGYDSIVTDVKVTDGGIVYKGIYMVESGINLKQVDVSAKREEAKTKVQISKVTVTSRQIKALPSIGGEADIAQYLTVLPGVILTGDQGGQLYIRGGSPIQNKILLDGMTIYNPFHSIGFFSVFETEAIRSVDVLTGGFGAEYGGRISAIVDIKTREGNKKRFGGTISSNPFLSKVLVEGPIKKLEEGGGSTSFLLTGKRSYLEQTSNSLYSYADSLGLPYNFTDLYGKLSFVTPNGSKFNIFGFNFDDQVNFDGLARFDWSNFGLGANFTLIPPSSSFLIGGTVAFSNYDILLQEGDEDPRTSSISSYSVGLDFTYFHKDNELNYGFLFEGYNTDFQFRNFLGITFQQIDFTSELSAFAKYKFKAGNLILEPGLRTQFYTAQSKITLEPRLGLKYNITEALRFKAAGGVYTQNLVSTVNEDDVVNLFVGFLSAPEETIFKPGTRDRTDDRLQRALHAVAGFELDLSRNLQVNVEPYYKRFSQLININRNKQSEDDPEFTTETGKAYGIDFLVKYETPSIYLWLAYSLGYVDRFDGEQTYPTVFDRRHNLNFLGTYTFGLDQDWEFGVRWNMGSGFPFTLTQGFYTNYTLQEGISSDVLTQNGELGIDFSETRNDGRLPYYHRLDISLKKRFEFNRRTSLEVTASVTNAYNRDNIFFFDRVEYERQDQLPVLPSLGLTFKF
ncbi:MAG: carboxypeptidase-like regulatory domain-containing protein [Bacteroidota bacterium]